MGIILGSQVGLRSAFESSQYEEGMWLSKKGPMVHGPTECAEPLGETFRGGSRALGGFGRRKV